MLGLSRKSILQIAVLLSGCFIAVLNYTLLAPALPVLMHEMDVTETQVQWVTSIYALVEAVVIPMNAFLMGRFSTRKLFCGGFALFAAGSLAAAFAPSFPLLLLGRVLQSIATGIAMPMVFTLVLLMTPRENRGSVMGLVNLVIAFAPAIGPPASGAIIDALGWRPLFGIVAACGIAVMVLALALLENHGPFERTDFDVPSIILLSFGMLGLLYGLSTCTTSATPAVSAVCMAIGIALLALFVRRQEHLDVPLLRVQTLKVSHFRNAIFVICLMEGALIAIDVLLPLFLQNVQGHTPTATGLAMAPAAIAGAIAGVIAGRIFDKHGVRTIALVGSTVLVISAVCLALCDAATPLLVVAGIYCIESIGWQSVSTPTDTWGVNSLPNEILQHGNAVMSTFMQVGAAFGTAALVSLTALGPLVAPVADAAAQMLAGYHVAFAGVAVLLALVGAVIVRGVRD